MTIFHSKQETAAAISSLLGTCAGDDCTPINDIADKSHCPPSLRRFAPWQLVCAFFSYGESGHCFDLLSNSEHAAIGSTASGYEFDHDWSFIRDATDDERLALYYRICLHIRNNRMAGKVTIAMRAAA